MTEDVLRGICADRYAVDFSGSERATELLPYGASHEAAEPIAERLVTFDSVTGLNQHGLWFSSFETEKLELNTHATIPLDATLTVASTTGVATPGGWRDAPTCASSDTAPMPKSRPTSRPATRAGCRSAPTRWARRRTR